MRRTNEHGFTLVEVLVAFAILSVTLTLIFRAFSLGTHGAQVSQQQLALVALAEAKLAGVGIESRLTPGNLAGNTASGMQWRIEATRLDAYDEFAKMSGFDVLSVSVTTTWPDRSAVRPVVLSTVKLARRR